MLIAIARLQPDRFVIKDGEADLPFGANDLDTVLTGTLMGHIAPGARARKAVLEAETGTHGILGLIESTTI